MSDYVRTRAALFLADSLEEMRRSDPLTVAALGRIAAASSTALFAKHAARSLAAIHTPTSLQFLAQLLDSPDRQIRTAAVNELSAFVMNLPVRTRDNFANMAWLKPAGTSTELTNQVKANVELAEIDLVREAQIVDFWKSWWRQNQSRLAPQS